MNIILITQWYPPEQAPIGYMFQELALSMQNAGHKVRVVTGFPNHPTGVVYSGYKKQWRKNTMESGVHVTRLYLFTHANPTKLNRILNFLSFTFASTLELLFGSKPDLVFSVSQPLSLGLVLPIIAKVKKFKLIFNIQDLHPDAAIKLGLIKNKVLIFLLKKIETFTYQHADSLAVICTSFKTHCVNKGARDAQVEVIHNWIDLDAVAPQKNNNVFKTSLGLKASDKVVLFAGTIGYAAGAKVIVDAAKIVSKAQDNIYFVFVGAGSGLMGLKSHTEATGCKNIIFAPFQARNILSEVQAISDISIVTMLAGKGRASVPSKVLGYMAAARPVIAAVDLDCETARLITLAKCGRVLNPENASLLAETIVLFINNVEQCSAYGVNGRKYLEKNYPKELVISKYISLFEKIALR